MLQGNAVTTAAGRLGLQATTFLILCTFIMAPRQRAHLLCLLQEEQVQVWMIQRVKLLISFILEFPPTVAVTAICSELHLRTELGLGTGHTMSLI